jgi:hypothetical protein
MTGRATRGGRWVDVYELSARYGLSTRTIWNVIRSASLEVRRGRPTERSTVDAQAFARALKAAPRRPRAKRG